MGRLAVRSVRYEGDRFVFKSGMLPDGVVIVEGSNGTGKTTLADLIYFGLGGNVDMFKATSTAKHVEITSDTNNYVELELILSADRYFLRRFIGSNDIGIRHGEKSTVEVFPVNRIGEARTFSDWFLNHMQIEPITVVQGSRSWLLGIQDLMRLMYHDQATDPTSIFKRPSVNDAIIGDSKDVRKTIFETLMGRGFKGYHANKGKLFLAERERDSSLSRLNAFVDAVQTIEESPSLNVGHLFEERDEIKKQFERLRKLPLKEDHS